ncbi:MAG: hypothetical protein ACLTAI_01500 [Thomasclavelia sp.]
MLIEVDESQIIKRSTITNLIASMINASYSAVIIFITRIVGVEGKQELFRLQWLMHISVRLWVLLCKKCTCICTNNEYTFLIIFI